MKRVIRKCVWESNSSSCHTLQIHNGYSEDSWLMFNKDKNKVIVEFGEFDWGYDRYLDAHTKLSYLITMLMECNSHCKTVEELYELEEFKELNDMIARHCKCDGILIINKIEDGYIDHESVYKSVNDFLNDYNISAEDFIFNTKIELIIDNDNR